MRKFSKAVIILILGMAFTKLTSFIENIVLARQYGASVVSDSFVLSLTLPNTIFYAIGTSIAACFVCVFQKRSAENVFRDKYISSLGAVLCAVGLLLSLLISINSKAVVSLLVSGDNSEIIELTSQIVRIVSWSSIFVFLVGMLQGYFQSIGSFFVVAFVNVPVNISIILFLLFSGNHISVLSYGILFSYIIQFCIILIICIKKGFRLNFDIKSTSPYIKETLLLFLPLFAGNLIHDVSVIIDKYFASSFGSGTISGLEYGYKISAIFYAIIANPVLTVFYPKLTNEIANCRNEEADELMTETSFFFEAFYGLLTVFVVFVSEPIVYILFYGGSFKEDALNITSNSLAMYMICIIPMTIRNTYEKYFLANHNVKMPMLNAILTMLVNVILNLVFSKALGYIGLPIATAISFVFSDAFLLFVLKKQYHYTISKNMRIKRVKIALISSCTMFTIWLTKVLFSHFYEYSSKIGALLLVICLFVISSLVYLSLMIVTNTLSKKDIKKVFNR